MRACGRVEKGNGFLTLWVRIEVRAIGHHGYKESAYGFATGIGGAAGAETDVPVGDVAGVGSACWWSAGG